MHKQFLVKLFCRRRNKNHYLTKGEIRTITDGKFYWKEIKKPPEGGLVKKQNNLFEFKLSPYFTPRKHRRMNIDIIKSSQEAIFLNTYFINKHGVCECSGYCLRQQWSEIMFDRSIYSSWSCSMNMGANWNAGQTLPCNTISE